MILPATRLSLLLIPCALLSACSSSHRSSPPIASEGSAVLGTASAKLLRAAPASSLWLRVSYVEGRAPAPLALQVAQERLDTYCHKPGGIRLTVEPLQAEPRGIYRVGDLISLVPSHPQAAPGELVLHVLYLDGRSGIEANQLGISFASQALAVFKDQVTASSDLFASLEGLEASVLAHELGHLLGLVGLGAPLTRPHRDPRAPEHCVNPCLMKARAGEWAEASQRRSPLASPPVPDFCSDCRADLVAHGGRATQD